MQIEDTFGARVLRARRARGLTQSELATACDLSTDAVGRIERGDVSAPSAQTLAQLATALDVEMAWLWKGES